MKVLFDISLACHYPHAKFHGGGDFTKQHLFDMLRYPKAEGNLELFSLNGSVIDEGVRSAIKTNELAHHTITNIHQLPDIVRTRKIDRIYSTSENTLRGLKPLPCRSLITIHGLRMLEKPTDQCEWHMDRRLSPRLSWLGKNLLPAAFHNYIFKKIQATLSMNRDLFLAVDSYHSKYAIANYYPMMDLNKITVLYPPPLKRPVNPLSQELPSEFLSQPYFLIVSANRWIKNTWRVVRALDKLFKLFPQLPHQVVLAGTTETLSLGKMVNPDRFHCLGYVDEAELDILYKNSFCLLYLSLNEGFGYPPVDAMRHGKPIIASPNSSISEVCRSAALYANPVDTDEILNRLLQVCFEADIVDDLRAAGKERFEQLYKHQKNHQEILYEGLFGSNASWEKMFE